jgi:predicted 2-oxoglutarate/Fe(II)-dependent dioxygenase YbiX
MIKPIEIKNFLSNEECDEIVKKSESFEFQQARTSYTKIKDVANEKLNFNKRKIYYTPSDFFPELSEKILYKLGELNLLNGIKYTSIPGYSFNQYIKDDFLNYHIDGDEIDHGATITLVLELSDNFEGGEFVYKINDIEYSFEKGKGSLYIFDSNTLHKVNKLINGIRYSINCWPRYSRKKSIL